MNFNSCGAWHAIQQRCDVVPVLKGENAVECSFIIFTQLLDLKCKLNALLWSKLGSMIIYSKIFSRA